MDDARHTLILDTDQQGLGTTALGLVRMGFSTHYARFLDEALLLVEQEQGRIRTVVVPPEMDAAAAGSVREASERQAGHPVSLVVIGRRPHDDARVGLRAAGASWAVWEPFDDSALRFVMNSAAALPEEIAPRREPRAPAGVIVWLRVKGTRCFGVLYSLSARGAFVEIPQPLPLGCKLRLEFSLGETPIDAPAEVIYRNAREDLRAPNLPLGCGLLFHGIEAGLEATIREFVTARSAQFTV